MGYLSINGELSLGKAKDGMGFYLVVDVE